MKQVPVSESTRQVDCPLCEGYGTLRDFLTEDGRPTNCWLCEGWGKVSVPKATHAHGDARKTA